MKNSELARESWPRVFKFAAVVAGASLLVLVRVVDCLFVLNVDGKSE